MKKLIYLFLTVFILSSCAAYHTGYMTNSVALSSANFTYVKKHITGSAGTTYIFGIGGRFTKETLVDLAKEDMLMKTQLNSNQALANLTVNYRIKFYFGVYIETTCIVTADVVEFK